MIRSDCAVSGPPVADAAVVRRTMERAQPGARRRFDVRQEGSRVRVVCKPTLMAFQGQSLESTVDVLLRELRYAVQNWSHRNFVIDEVLDEMEYCVALTMSGVAQQPPSQHTHRTA